MTMPLVIGSLLALLVTFGGTAVDSAAAVPTIVAQLAIPTAAPASAPFGVIDQGLYATAPIILDGVTLFRIAAPADPGASQDAIAGRVSQVQSAIAQLLAENGSGVHATPIFDPRTLRIHARRSGDAVVLEAIDAKHPDPLPIVTVTSIDGRANGTDVEELAGSWQTTLQSALVQALVLRQPAVERQSLVRVLQIAAAVIAFTLLIYLVLRRLWQQMSALEAAIADRSAFAGVEASDAAETPDAGARRRRFWAFQLRSLAPAERLGLLSASAEFAVWIAAFAWLIAGTWSLSLFAETTPLAQTIAHGTFGVLTTIVVAFLLSRALDALIARTTGAWRFRRFANSEDRARTLLRAPTIARTLAGAKSFAIIFIAALSVLSQVGVPIGSVVTIGGLAAIALSLAAQNFVRDFLNGFLVLLEDQYVVGDYVTINAFSGIVEALTLRMVQIRDAAGDLVTIPHSSVTSVLNQSRNWSRVDYRVPVDPAADVHRAIEIVREQIIALKAELDHAPGIGEPIEWIGIDALSRDWVIVRASVRTAPLEQFELRRKINERVLTAFTSAGIALGAQLPVP